VSVAAPTLTWEQYQALPPAQRRRPLTPAEYAALTKQQRIAGGLEDDDRGAPADFNGPVFPNPTHIQPRLDTDPAIPPTRLPEGVSFQKGNWSGAPPMDLSNPATADVVPTMGREVGADFSGAKNSDHSVSSTTTVPMFSPDGTLGDIPYEQMQAARAAGAKPGVSIKAPDGSLGVVPADRYQDAMKAGGTVVPIKDQETQHPGFWSTLASDFGAMGKSILNAGPEGSDLSHMSEDTAYMERLKAEGHSLPYRALMSLTPRSMRESAEQGDVGGVAAHAVVPATVVAAGPLAAEADLGALATRVKPAIAKVGNAATAVGESLDPDVVGLASPRAAHGLRLAAKIGKVATKLGTETAPEAGELDATAENRDFAGEPPPKPAKVLDATGENKPFAGGMDEYVPPRPKAPRTIVTNPATGRPEFSDVVAAKQAAPPETKGEPAPVETKAVTTAGGMDEYVPPRPKAPRTIVTNPATGAGIPRTLSGDSALRQVLTGQDTPNLMKIAKSRGINVTQESQLKPSLAGPRLISKIIDDFSPEELDNLGASYLENTRMGRHNFGDIGAEANKTLSMQTYFPDVNVPLATTLRTQKAITAAGATKLTPIENLPAQIKASPAANPAPRTIVTDPSTGHPELSDVIAAKGQPAATGEDLTQQLQASLDSVRARKAAAAAGKSPGGASGSTATVPGQGETPRFVYRARDPGESGVPLTQEHAQATSDLNQAMKYAEPGQRGEGWGQVVRIDLSKLEPKDFVVKTHPDGMKWVQFKRPLTEDEVTPFAGQAAGAKQNVNPVQVGQ